MTHSFTQVDLDQLISERLSWTAQFATFASHDLANILLFSVSPSHHEGAISDELLACRQQQAELTTHLRQIMKVMQLWRYPDAIEPQPLTIESWWALHGGMIRQFVPPPARVLLVKYSPGLMLDGMHLNRMLVAMLIALTAQLNPFRTIALSIIGEEDGTRVCLTLDVSTAIDAQEFLLPSIVVRHMHADGSGFERRSNGNTELFVLNLAASSIVST